MSILAIDAGTTGVTVLIVSERGEIASRGYCEFEQHFPQPAWVEHDPEQIWDAVISATKMALVDPVEIHAIGITNQRETLVLWDRETLQAPRRAIVWQDRRTSEFIEDFRSHAGLIHSKTGTNLDPYFTSTKLVWIQRNEPEIWERVVRGELAVGTIDSYLVARLSGGISHITDASNASRTQLCDIDTGEWDAELLEVFNVPLSALPEIVPNYGNLSKTNPEHFLGIEVPISGMAGDQQAALFGQTAFKIGDAKCTYGTGAFLLVNTGNKRVESNHGLISTIAWKDPNGEITYALEGSVFVAGSAVQWLRDGLKIIKNAADIESLALQVPDSGGVVFVPALTGLGAPWWNPEVRGSITGITRGTTDAHIARATLEAVAFEVTDLVVAMESDLGSTIGQLRVDGGMCGNKLFLELQASALNRDLMVGKNLETTALGAAYLAGLGRGIFESMDSLQHLWQRAFDVQPGSQQSLNYRLWSAAVKNLNASS